MVNKSVEMEASNDNNSTQVLTNAEGLMKKLKFLEEDRKTSYQHWQYENNDNCSVRKVCLD